MVPITIQPPLGTEGAPVHGEDEFGGDALPHILAGALGDFTAGSPRLHAPRSAIRLRMWLACTCSTTATCTSPASSSRRSRRDEPTRRGQSSMEFRRRWVVSEPPKAAKATTSTITTLPPPRQGRERLSSTWSPAPTSAVVRCSSRSSPRPTIRRCPTRCVCWRRRCRPTRRTAPNTPSRTRAPASPAGLQWSSSA